MRLEELLTPISPDAPCGEDLLAVDDSDYVEYYFNVEDRFPASYFNVVRETLFDPRSIDHKAETAQIDALLKRTRDLRLLGIEAKFQILATRFKGFVDTVMAMAALLEAFPDDVHPVDPVDRRNALEELNTQQTIAAPLEYAVLLNDRRAGDIILRMYNTGSGKTAVRSGETAGSVSSVMSALGSSESSAAVDALHAQVTGLQDALKRIAAVCMAGPGAFRPTMDRLEARLDEIVTMILTARGDLGTPQADTTGAGEAEGDEPADGAAASGSGTAAGSYTIQATPAEVPDHRAAYRVLEGIETYFAQNEPTSLALILVTQSRLLIGRPLSEALDTLLESNSGYAKVQFGNEGGFVLSMERMRTLAGYVTLRDSDAFSTPQEDDPPAVEVVSRDHAGALLKAVEEFFRVREPASPIPILLFKARNMLTKDFHALIRELIPE